MVKENVVVTTINTTGENDASCPRDHVNIVQSLPLITLLNPTLRSVNKWDSQAAGGGVIIIIFDLDYFKNKIII